MWTFLPCIILIFLGWPRIQLLYSLENNEYFNSLTLKVIGHQWYWSYDYGNFNNLIFDSFIILENDLNIGDFRLLEVDNKVILPFNRTIRVLIISADVLHAWALPSIGIKADANPGRLNQRFLFSISPGSFYGQCSELCGVNHSFIPINIEFTSLSLFKNWLKLAKNIL
jgi:cytochrome c oxidase subunit 2